MNVAELYLQKNQLSSLTDTYGFHFMLESLANLKVLDLSFNQLKKLPSGIGGLAKLEVLELRGNGVSYFLLSSGITALNAARCLLARCLLGFDPDVLS